MELKLFAVNRRVVGYFDFNRTRWNWNSLLLLDKACRDFILIVPDGIETCIKISVVFCKIKILIVPDGIETNFIVAHSSNPRILIVPDGIETGLC